MHIIITRDFYNTKLHIYDAVFVVATGTIMAGVQLHTVLCQIALRNLEINRPL